MLTPPTNVLHRAERYILPVALFQSFRRASVSAFYAFSIISSRMPSRHLLEIWAFWKFVRFSLVLTSSFYQAHFWTLTPFLLLLQVLFSVGQRQYASTGFDCVDVIARIEENIHIDHYWHWNLCSQLEVLYLFFLLMKSYLSLLFTCLKYACL